MSGGNGKTMGGGTDGAGRAVCASSLEDVTAAKTMNTQDRLRMLAVTSLRLFRPAALAGRTVREMRKIDAGIRVNA